MKTKKSITAVSATALGALVLSGCAGGAGGGQDTAAGEGVEPRADFSAYQEALADMPETTLVYQASAQSPEGPDALRSEEFKKNVEEASGGRIEVELVHGQAIAAYGEVPAALEDGRIDIAYMLNIYDPANFPVTSAFSAGTTLAGGSPRAAEMAANAAFLEVGWDSPALMAEYEEHSMVPLVPVHAMGGIHAVCAEPVDTLADWKGKQLRVGTAGMVPQAESLGATPVSLSYLEAYEGLQRGTVDCMATSPVGAAAGGVVEVAPHLRLAEEANFARGIGAIAAGPSFETLPLAAQQLVFDQLTEVFNNSLRSDLESNIGVAETALANGGSIAPMDAETEAKIKESSAALIQEQVDKGLVPEDFADTITERLDYWTGVTEEMGYGDEGDFETLSEWHDTDPEFLMPFSERVFDEVISQHRPE
ncbi:C4-dicarboxylate ABC transporter substrate-binding protein [Brevibacterium sp.]|uniref:C4-dicarboxylate ABC transporter substrate-binding protein n=1 Tax=Brevibacterium sp. TaxID=1701 RepID=UPI0025C4469D|nr:C4-dicarboxylate ABC transporter substrate-binding protein [Brevibacterium sp.]